MEPAGEYVELQQVLHILRKHIRMILLIPLCCGALGFLISNYLMKPSYQADATLIVNPGSSQNTTITYDQVSLAKQLVGTYSIIMKSNTVLSQVISDLQLKTDVKNLSDAITIEGVDETEVIQLTVKSDSKEKSKEIANEIIEISSPLIIDTVKAGSVEIISPTRVEDKPVSPNKILNTAVAFLLGLALSVVLSFIVELTKNNFTSDEDVKRNLELNVLGLIPHY